MPSPLDDYRIAEEPFYRPAGGEVALYERAYAHRMPLILKGPTGCGKTRFVEYMAWKLGRPLVTLACNEDMTASDLIGRYLLDAGGTAWHDGPLTQAVRHGGICYLDEVVEARQDTTVVIHPLTDARRVLPLDKKGELVRAHPDFQLVVSYNPGYQSSAKDMKASTRQRFAALEFGYPEPALEAEIVAHESGIDGAGRAPGAHRRGLARAARPWPGRGRVHPHADLCRRADSRWRQPGGQLRHDHDARADRRSRHGGRLARLDRREPGMTAMRAPPPSWDDTTPAGGRRRSAGRRRGGQAAAAVGQPAQADEAWRWIQALHEEDPECAQAVAERLDLLMARLSAGGLGRWCWRACGDTSARRRAAPYFQLRDPYAREALHGEAAARELEALQAPLSYLLTGLSRRAMTVEPQRRQSLFGPPSRPILTATHLLAPDSYTVLDGADRWALCRAVARPRTAARAPRNRRVALALAVVSAIEDARVERLLCAAFPGARRWFRPSCRRRRSRRPELRRAGGWTAC